MAHAMATLINQLLVSIWQEQSLWIYIWARARAIAHFAILDRHRHKESHISLNLADRIVLPSKV